VMVAAVMVAMVMKDPVVMVAMVVMNPVVMVESIAMVPMCGRARKARGRRGENQQDRDERDRSRPLHGSPPGRFDARRSRFIYRG
jgi:hypothetical protein